ncbi:MAG: SnoaL-like domain-containing protein [Gammaproteobacteria bacterium]|jgi:limonene-1,2-epoxide hydrolase|nr:SnoaL-like domain-containing protein [Gammaproteobacteria bacterium]
MTNTEVVLNFIQAWNNMDWAAVEDAFTEDVVYHNIPMEPIHGKAAAAAVGPAMGPREVDWQTLHIAENGNVVLTERIDNFIMSNGKGLSIPVMGTFEIEEGKIKAWRDYFDLATFTSQMA